MTKEFIGNKEGKLTGLKTVEVEWITNAEGEKELIEKKKIVRKYGIVILFYLLLASLDQKTKSLQDLILK